MSWPYVICTGHDTCTENCKCRYPHMELKVKGFPVNENTIVSEDLQKNISLSISGQYCSDPNWGSCWHNNHEDKEFHECYHEIYEEK